MRALTIISFLWLASGTFAQDTLKVLTLDIFLQHVREHHPVALVAGNEVEQAERVIQLSKGSFDPVLFSDIDQKYYDGKTYYSTISSGIKIPTRLGFNLKASGDWNRGDYLNPQNRVPADGLSYLGVEIPVGRGLLTDERRTQLKRAGVAWQQSQVERQLTLNELLFEAGEQFIFWQEQEAQLLLAEEGFELSRIRLEQVRVNAMVGERPAIDTVEASAQYYNRLIDLEQRRLNTQNARLRIEQYLWDQGMIPLQLEASVQPEKLTVNAPVSLLQPIDNHPAIQWYDLKTADLQLERKLKIEMLKPQLNLNYNLLQTPENLMGGQLSFSDYKWGATFYVPLLLRKERASLAITRLKLSSVQWDLQQKQRELQIKQLQVRNEWNTHVTQAESSRIAASRYQQLAAAERSLFELGESSLFLINAREMSYLSAQSKYLEYVAKTRKSALKESYTMGRLGL
jgi:outer membrane protein TolC